MNNMILLMNFKASPFNRDATVVTVKNLYRKCF